VTASKTTAVDRAANSALRRLDTFRVLLGPRFAGTWSLVAVTVLFYALEALAGGTTDPAALTRLGALRTDLVAEHGEWYRLLCPMFLHYGPIHLLMNGFALIQLAAIVESISGTARMVVLYLVCGVAAAVTSAVLNDPLGNASVGASGAIMGLAGVLVGWALYGAEPLRSDLRAMLLRRLLVAVGLTFALGIAVWLVAPVIDNWAHFGGFIAGLLCAGMVSDPLHEPGPPAWAALGGAITFTAFGWGAMAHDGGRATASLHVDLARLAWQASLREPDGLSTAGSLARMVRAWHAAGAPDRSRALLDARLAAMAEPETPAMLGALLYSMDGTLTEQISAYQRWAELAPEDPSAWNALAWTTLLLGDDGRALRLADRAVGLVPEDAEPVLRGAILETHAQALRHTKPVEALAEQREAVLLLEGSWSLWLSGELDAVAGRLAEMESAR
jgi:rhomboid protease GluP